MTIEPRSLVVIAGLPGSGKSTLLRGTRSDRPLVVLDSDQMRDRLAALVPEGTPYSRYRPLVHVLHRLRVTLAVLREPGPVVVHDPATGVATRAWLMVLGRLSGRARHFLWVECSPEDAEAGQCARGRVVRHNSFRRHVRRLPHMRALLGGGLRGWNRTAVVDRSKAASGLRLVVPGLPAEAASGRR
ncbi:MAG TPA: AAA family ATPase [Amycolatopsis sp.]|uniref:AAA family ATPase n=1 Tax=Amycolatopsis sp. TaxID=37632 RepID=UPI002B46B087|nr:AAA family ATPase [Amycolatopsis sp.]HKS48052.1 AAA family ATPase [Amycolatopsis sp.]